MTALRNVLIRAARLEDKEFLFRLATDFASSFMVEEAVFHSSFRMLQDDPAACLLVAEVEGVVIGYVLGFHHLTFFAGGRVAWVEEIMVGEAFRQRGAGRQLMDAFAAWGKSTRMQACRVSHSACSALLPSAWIRRVGNLFPKGVGMIGRKSCYTEPSSENDGCSVDGCSS
jgi:GNAT superfamily N-acetyltransferase